MKTYINRENRKIIMIKEEDGKYHTHSYARYLMEQHLGRKLLDDEEVHHIDGDKTNDIIENLKVINKTEHRYSHNPKKYQDTTEHCYICGKEFIFTAKQHSNNYRQRNKKPDTVDKYFCSRQCSGKYGKLKQEHLL